MKAQIYTILLTLVLFSVSCSKINQSYMIGFWAVDSISYRGKNYIDSMLFKQLDIANDRDLLVPLSTVYIPNYDESKLEYSHYYIITNEEHPMVLFETEYKELNGKHQLEFRNDTLRHYFLMIIKSKDLYIRAIRLNFTYDSPSGLKIVEDFEKWPKKGEYQFVPLPDSVLR